MGPVCFRGWFHYISAAFRVRGRLSSDHFQRGDSSIDLNRFPIKSPKGRHKVSGSRFRILRKNRLIIWIYEKETELGKSKRLNQNLSNYGTFFPGGKNRDGAAHERMKAAMIGIATMGKL